MKKNALAVFLFFTLAFNGCTIAGRRISIEAASKKSGIDAPRNPVRKGPFAGPPSTAARTIADTDEALVKENYVLPETLIRGLKTGVHLFTWLPGGRADGKEARQ